MLSVSVAALFALCIFLQQETLLRLHHKISPRQIHLIPVYDRMHCIVPLAASWPCEL